MTGRALMPVIQVEGSDPGGIGRAEITVCFFGE